jgi:hypothetical protein
MVHAKTGHEILPALWSDNFISLLPGESRTLKVKFPGGMLHDTLKVEASSFNQKVR